MPNVPFPVPDFNDDIVRKYEELFETGKRKGIHEIATDEIHQLLKRYSGGFGTFAYAIMDFHNSAFLYVSEDIDRIWGYTSDQLSEGGLPFLSKVFPPGHLQTHFKVSAAGWTFGNSLPPKKLLYSIANFDNVNKKKNGELVRVLTRQITVKLDGNEKIWLTLAIFNDISHVKKPDLKDNPRMSYYIPKTGKFLVYNPTTEKMINLEVLTDRERDILRLSAINKTAGEIADELFISPYTVQTHRANVLKKTGCRNLAELIFFSKYHFPG